MNQQSKKPLHFKTNIQLKSIIGKDLINNDNIAVLELVKNSYDAGSPNVIVQFKNLKKNDDAQHSEDYSENSSKILIKDFGIGMDEDDLENKWLNIAYSEKKKDNEREGRTMAGAKGVGRFSCDRLGRFLDMYTRKKGNPIYRIYIDWKKFEIGDKRDLEIQEVPVIIEEVSMEVFKERFEYNFEHGTLIEISKLRSQWVMFNEKKTLWEAGKILDLRRYLEKLLNPNQAYESKGFIIELIAEELKPEDTLKMASMKINGIIENKIFQKLEFTTTAIESKISTDGDTITTTLTDKNREVFRLKEKNVEYTLLTDVTISIFYLNPYSKAYFKKHTGIRSVKFGSIFLFINGFRVNPLGDSGDDWLRMEVRKGQRHRNYLGTREVIGRIEINDHKGNFKIISSREGIVKDSRFDQIVAPSLNKGFFYKTLKRLEKYVVEGLDWDKTELKGRVIEKIVDSNNWKYEPTDEKYQLGQHKKNENVMGLLSSLVLQDTEKENIINLHIDERLIKQLLSEQKDKAREKFNKFFTKNPLFSKETLDDLTWDTINSVREELEEKKKELRQNLNTLAKKEHQISLLTKEKGKLKKELEKEKEKVGKLEKKGEKQVRQNYLLQQHLAGSSEYTQLVNLYHHVGISSGIIEQTLRNLKRKMVKGTLTDDTLLEQLDAISMSNRKIKSISRIATNANVVFNSKSLILEGENLTEFIIQYMENVGKFMLKDRIRILVDKKGIYAGFIHDFNTIDIIMLFDNLFNNAIKAKATTVAIEVISHSSELLVKVRDNGCGVSEEYVDDIFDLGFSTTNGTGFGLFHVRSILGEINGEISLNAQFEKGSEFIIKVRK